MMRGATDARGAHQANRYSLWQCLGNGLVSVKAIIYCDKSFDSSERRIAARGN
jgi:hypothetical protein